VTSGRVCSLARKLFFKADLAPQIKPRHRAAAPGDVGRPHCLDDLIQGEVGLLVDDALTLPLCSNLSTHLIAELGLPSNRSAASWREAPSPTAATTRNRKSSE
jgi:hypothetical protein